MGADFRLLGQFEVEGADAVLKALRRRERCLLGVLLLQAGGVVSTERLVDLLWEQPPDSARAALHTHVARVRRALDTAGLSMQLRSARDGYVAEADPATVDVHRFRHLLGRASAAEAPARKASLLRDALALWRGPILAGDASDRLRNRIGADLAELRLTATVRMFGIELGMGDDPAAVVGRLIAAVSEHPHHEQLVGQLMIALYRCGRHAEVLDVYQRTRDRFANDLGVDPGPLLQRMHAAVLRGDETALVALGTDLAIVVGAETTTVNRGPTVAPAQLPGDARGFTGRGDELAQLSRILDTAGQHVTAGVIAAVSGTAGVGKTALAVRWAHQVADRFPDGQLFANLQGFSPAGRTMAPADAVRGFLDALGVPPERIPANLDAQAALYRTQLAGKRVLIVLDNARDADQIRPLLPGTSTAMVVVTSRTQLTGLVTADGAHPLTVGLLSESDARELLTQRIGAERTAAEPAAVERIISACARLPLALAIAAARAYETGFPLSAIADELDHVDQRLDFLDTGDQASHVRTVFSWSYKALQPPAARLFQLLALHPGPDITVPVAASLAGIAARQARALLADLTRAHMVAEHSPGRFTLHDLLRVYASEQVDAHHSEAERRAAILRMHDHYLHTAHAMDRALDPHRDTIVLQPCRPDVTVETPADSGQALAWFKSEQSAILSILQPESAAETHLHTWSLAWALMTFFDRQGHWHDLIATQRAALDAALCLADKHKEAYAHRYLGRAFTRLGDHEQADLHLRSALTLFAEIGDIVGQAGTYRGLSWVAEGAGRLPDALRNSERALELFRAADHRAGQADSLNAVGWFRGLLGDYQLTLDHCGKALTLLCELGDRYGQAATLDSLGYAHHHLGDYAKAAHCYQSSVDLLRETGDRHHEAEVLVHLGDTHHAAGATSAARTAWQAALNILVELGHPGVGDVRAKLRRLHWV